MPASRTKPRHDRKLLPRACRGVEGADERRRVQRGAGTRHRRDLHGFHGEGVTGPRFVTRPMHVETAFLFDLDGTLVDSVYQHVLSWKEALDAEGIELSVWRIHRRIGMSGGLFLNQLLRETDAEISQERLERLRHRHAAAFVQRAG